MYESHCAFVRPFWAGEGGMFVERAIGKAIGKIFSAMVEVESESYSKSLWEYIVNIVDGSVEGSYTNTNSSEKPLQQPHLRAQVIPWSMQLAAESSISATNEPQSTHHQDTVSY